MKKEEFVKRIRESVIKDNLDSYKDLFRNTSLENVKDGYWLKALPFFKSLDENWKIIFFEIVKQIEVDTTSNILGILDGTIYFGDQDEDFVLTIKNSNQVINGELQSLFLEQE